MEGATLRAHLVGRAQGADALARSEVTSLVAAARRSGRMGAGLGGGGWAAPTTAPHPERIAPLGAAGSCSTSPAGSLATSISTTGDRGAADAAWEHPEACKCSPRRPHPTGAADAAWERFYTHGGDTFLQSALMTSTASKSAQELIWS